MCCVHVLISHGECNHYVLPTHTKKINKTTKNHKTHTQNKIDIPRKV